MTNTRLRTATERIDAFLVAPHATAGERLVTYLAAVTGGAVAVTVAARAGLPALSLVVIAVVAVDAFGGAVANATSSAKRWWHRPGRTGWHHLGFVVAHLQPFLLAWTVPGFGWTAAIAVYAAAVVGGLVVVAMPADLRRPVGFGVTALCIAVLATVVPVPSAVAWFAPVLLIKLLLAHVLPESGPGPAGAGPA